MPETIIPGVYAIVNRKGQALDLPAEHAGDTAEEVEAQGVNGTTFQEWVIEPDPDREGGYLIRWAGTADRYLQPENGDELDDGAEIWYRPRASNHYQTWQFYKATETEYKIQNHGSGMVMDLRDNGPDVQQRPWTGVPNQVWSFRHIRN